MVVGGPDAGDGMVSITSTDDTDTSPSGRAVLVAVAFLWVLWRWLS